MLCVPAPLCRRAVPGVLLMLLAGTASAAEFRVPTGLWEMTSTSTMSMMPQARTNTQRECITEQNNDPVRLMSQESGCELIEQQVEGNTLRWQMRCAMDQGEATAQGRFTLNGDEADGEMLMEMSMQGMPVSMEMLWSGRRVGDC